MDVTFDTIAPGTEFSIDGSDGVTIVRTGVIAAIDASAASDPFVLLRAADAAIAKAGQTHPGMSNAVINRLVVKSAKSTNDCTFSVTYRAGPLARTGGGVRWLVEDDSTLAHEEEEVDLKGNPIQVIFTDANPDGSPAGPDAETDPAKVAQEAADAAKRAKDRAGGSSSAADESTFPHRLVATFPAPVLRPRRALTVSGYMIGRPSANVVDAQDCVNSVDWQGKKKGYWLCTRASSSAERGGMLNEVGDPFANAGSLFRVEAQFLSKVRRDWGHHFIHRTIKGKLAKQMCSPEFAAKIKSIIDGEYSTDQVRCNGFTKVGMYELANFPSIFQF